MEKLYFTIGETSEMLNVPVSTVRFWENEFDILKPMKNKKGNRLFTQADIRNLRIIQRLLKDEGMTIPGARKKLAGKWEEIDYKQDISESLLKIKSLLLDLGNNF
jgi:DNA-binding transcriptional MerR regulator